MLLQKPQPAPEWRGGRQERTGSPAEAAGSIRRTATKWRTPSEATGVVPAAAGLKGSDAHPARPTAGNHPTSSHHCDDRRPATRPATCVSRSSRPQADETPPGGSVERSGIGRGRAARARRRYGTAHNKDLIGRPNLIAHPATSSTHRSAVQTKRPCAPGRLPQTCCGCFHPAQEQLSCPRRRTASLGSKPCSIVPVLAARPCTAGSPGELSQADRHQQAMRWLARVSGSRVAEEPHVLQR